MRQLQLLVPSDVRNDVEDALEEMGAGYLFVDEDTDRDGAVAYVPVPAGAVDNVLYELYEAGLPEDTYRVVSDITHANTPHADDMSERFVDGPTGGRGASHPEIRERALDLKPGMATYVAFAALSTIVAVGGLLLNSAIVIVGAMVIAPFAGSTLSGSVGTVLGDREMVVDSASSQAVGLVVGFLGAVIMSVVVRQTGFVPGGLAVSRIDQVSTFLTPNILTLVIAIAAGIAGALALATDLPVSIAGVAVAAAIVPATATAGIGFVWREPLIVLGATVLLLMNIVFINLAAYVALVGLGYRSSFLQSVRENLDVSVRTGAWAILLVVFGSLVLLTTAGTVQHLAFEQDVNQEVGAVIEQDEYAALELVNVQTEYNDVNVLGTDESISVTVSRSTDAEFEQLDDVLQRRISRETNRPVTVSVRFLDYQEARPDDGGTRSPSLVSRLGDGMDAFIDRLRRVLAATTLWPSAELS